MESLLFSPLTIRGLTLRNRIVVSPMLTYSATNGYTNDTHLAHLAKFAVGGAGLVFVESTKIDPRGCSTPRDLGLWKNEFIPGMRRIVCGYCAGIFASRATFAQRVMSRWICTANSSGVLPMAWPAA